MVLPSDFLLPYQKEMLKLSRENQLCIFLCSRQVGKSHVLSHIAVEKAWTNPNSKIIILSTGERASMEVLDKCKKIAQIFETCFADTAANFKVDITAAEVRISNGSKIVTLPSGDSAKIRGYSPILVVCDEFALLDNATDFYEAIFPSITSPFGGKKSLIISSTPMGTQNLFWRLWTEKNDYAKYSLDIYQAQKQGLRVDIDLLKKNFDSDMFAQEFLCQPMDAVTSLFTYELLNSVTYKDPPQALVRYGGMDIGRHSDRTSIVILASTPDGRVFIEQRRTLQNMEFRDQFKEASSMIRAFNLRKFCVDATGLGMQLAEDLQREFGPVIEPITFTNANKVEMFNGLKKAFSDGTCLIPDDPDLKKEFQSIKRVVSANSISYQADRDDSGHADNAVASALAHYAYLLSNKECDFLPIAFT